MLVSTPSTTSDWRDTSVKTSVDGPIRAIAFSANGEYLVSGDKKAVQVWRMTPNGILKPITTMAVGIVNCLAVSKDGRRIAAGRWLGDIVVWDASTFKKIVPTLDLQSNDPVNGVDFSPDSTRVVTASDNRTATVWDVKTNTRTVLKLHHEDEVRAAKYSPQGDQIATATRKSVHVFHSTGVSLVNVEVNVTPWYNTGLVWSRSHILVISENKIKEIKASTGSLVSEWSVFDGDSSSCIAMPMDGDFIAYSTNRAIAFWDTTLPTHAQLGLTQLSQDIRSISISPDNRWIAVGGTAGEITIKDISRCTVAPIRHDILASRALIRTRLRQWDAAIRDAEESITMRPSVLAYVVKSIALAYKGERRKAYRACDIAFGLFQSTCTTSLLLVKASIAIVVFISGEPDDALSRVDDLIATVPLNAVCYVVQAYIHLLLGNSHMESRNYEDAIHSFECARAHVRQHTSLPLLAISLISGWKFDGLGIVIQQRLRDALFAAGRMNDASKSLLTMVATFGEEAYATGSMTQWVSDFTRRCLSAPEGAALKEIRGDKVPVSIMNAEIMTPVVNEWAKANLANGCWKDALASAADFLVPRFTIYRVICERLEAINRITDVIMCLQQMAEEFGDESNMRGEQTRWIVGLNRRCAERSRYLGDVAADSRRYDDAVTQYSAALSLKPANPEDIYVPRSKVYMAMGLWEDAIDDATRVIALDPSSTWRYDMILKEWAKVTLTNKVDWQSALSAATRYRVSRFAVYRAICECLEMVDRIVDAAECLREMEKELARMIRDKEIIWFVNFKFRCRCKLEALGNAAMKAQQYNEAISYYSPALSLSTAPHTLFINRSKAHSALSMWADALGDANEAIVSDASSPFGYEAKYFALRGVGRHQDMIETFETMMSKMSHSSELEIQERYRHYASIKATIRRVIQDAIRDLPRALIDTTSGRLCNKSAQAAAFERSPAFTELILSMTPGIDHARIKQEVTEYYRYATFSHKWEDNEPLFEKVMHVVVYDLEESSTHDKLQMFCKIVRDAGFYWAWSDTCCINKADHFVLQEALVAMFKWYEGSALTVVFLRGVRSPARRGDLVRSIWNTRAWTFQEYHASKVVRFYAEDWTPYLNLDLANHKDSPEIIAEMEEATGISARALKELRPGLDDIREKLCLASRRETTFVEDEAYSLLGIFSASLPVVYGEGDKSLGRLLAQLLTSSGDTSILAWTGRSGTFNSCLPASIAAFSQLQNTHIPPAIEQAEMDLITARLQASSLDFTSATRLYDVLNELPVPQFAGRRMKLPCIMFKLRPLSASLTRSEYVFRAQTTALGIVAIRTTENLSRFNSLYLIHPWIDFLLDRQPVGSLNVSGTIHEEGAEEHFPSIRVLPSQSFPDDSNITSDVPQIPASRHSATFRQSIHGQPPPYSEVASLRPPSSISLRDTETRALQLITRLRQPFGALLLAPNGSVAAYSRVAAESLITVQVEGITPMVLNKLVDSVRVLDLL